MKNEQKARVAHRTALHSKVKSPECVFEQALSRILIVASVVERRSFTLRRKDTGVNANNCIGCSEQRVIIYVWKLEAT